MTRLDHVTVTATDFAASVGFYDAALGALALIRLAELVDEEESSSAIEAAAWGPPDGAGLIWLVGGQPASAGLHICLQAESRDQVEAFFDEAIRSGGRPHAAPRRWTIYRRGEFNAIVADPDGNLLEAVAPE